MRCLTRATMVIFLLLGGCSSTTNVPLPPEPPCHEQVISGFEQLDEWQLVSVEGYVLPEPAAAEGSASLRITTGNSGVVIIHHTLSSPLNLSKRALNLKVLSEDPLSISNLGITLTVGSGAKGKNEISYSFSNEIERQLDRWDAHVWTTLALNPMRTAPNKLNFLNQVEAITLWLHTYAPNTSILVDALKHVPRRSDQRVITITVDDGHFSSATEILPILETNHFTATAFITPRTIGKDKLHLSQTQLELLTAAGWEIGGHDTVAWSSYSPAELEKQLDEVVEGLSKLGLYGSQTSFAYPHGDYRTALGSEGRSIREATLAHFATARSIKNGINIVGAEDSSALLTLLRLPDSLTVKKEHLETHSPVPQNQSFYFARLDKMSPGDYAIITYHRVVEPGQVRHETEIERTVFIEDITHLSSLERDKGYVIITLARFLKAYESAREDGVCLIDKYLKEID